MDEALVEEPDDRELFGWKALEGYASPFNWPIVALLVVVFVATLTGVENLELTDSLKLAVTSMTVLLAADLLGLVSTRVEPQPTRSRRTDRVFSWIQASASVAIVSILVHVALPAGNARDLLAAVSAVLVLATILLVFRPRNIVEHRPRLVPEDGAYPPTRFPLAWTVDLVMSTAISIILGSLIVVAKNAVSEEIYDPKEFATFSLVCCSAYIYQIVTIRMFGCTYGQRLARIRVVTERQLRRPKLSTIALRTLIPIASVYTLVLAISLEATGAVNEENGVWYSAFVVGAVFLMLLNAIGFLSLVFFRNIHPRGQGVIDLITKTVVMPADKVFDTTDSNVDGLDHG